MSPESTASTEFDASPKFDAALEFKRLSTPQFRPGRVTVWDRPYYVLQVADVWNKLEAYDIGHVLSSIQAIANARQATLFFKDRSGIHGYWLNRLKDAGGPLAERQAIELSDWRAVVETFRNKIDGAVVWGEDCWATRNVAITVAGADGRRLIVLRKDPRPTSIYTLLTNSRAQGGFEIPVVMDLTDRFTGTGTIWDTTMASTGSKKNDAYKWAIAKYVQTGKVNANLAAYRLDGYWIYKTQTLGRPDVALAFDNDYLIANRAFVFDLDPWSDEIPMDDPGQPLGLDAITMRVIYEQLYLKSDRSRLIQTIGFPPFTAKYSTDAPAGPTGLTSAHAAWMTEWKTVEIASNYNSYLETDIEGTANGSFYRFIPRNSYRQSVPSGESKKWLYERGYLSRTSGLVEKKYVLLTSSDFDAVSWLQIFLVGNTQKLWLDPKRGQIPIAWAINPGLVDRVPNIFNHLYATRSENDFFVAGNSGIGYVNPSMLLGSRKLPGGMIVDDGVDAWSRQSQAYYRLLDYSITNNIINGNAGELEDVLLERFAEFSPLGATALGSREPGRLIRGMPFLGEARSFRAGLGSTAASIADGITESVAARSFAQFRTILVPPSVLVDALDIVRSRDPMVEVVDPFTFFELAKISLGMDIIPPACNFLINDGASTTLSREVRLGRPVNHFDYPPNASGVVALRFSNDGVAWTTYSPSDAAAGIQWTLTPGPGLKTVYMQAGDRAGNWGNSDSQVNHCSARITLAP